jgi:hypothetical protein
MIDCKEVRDEMTNQKINIEIEDFEDKKSQNGKRYTRFKTSQGWMSAFEKDIIDALKEREGEIVCVEIAVDEEKGFKNIRKFIGDAQEEDELDPTPTKPSNFGKAQQETKVPVVRDNTTMYVSYAKDIFCKLVENAKESTAQDLMGISIALVKQARTEFETTIPSKAS